MWSHLPLRTTTISKVIIKKLVVCLPKENLLLFPKFREDKFNDEKMYLYLKLWKGLQYFSRNKPKVLYLSRKRSYKKRYIRLCCLVFQFSNLIGWIFVEWTFNIFFRHEKPRKKLYTACTLLLLNYTIRLLRVYYIS